MNNAIILTKSIFLIKYISIIFWVLFRENKSTSLRDHLTSSTKTNTEAVFKGPKHSTQTEKGAGVATGSTELSRATAPRRGC